jgi:nucleotide-binding universal stress UspA family protein
METTLIPAGTVVVGVDGSPSADRAVDWAVDQAVLERRQIALAHAVDPDSLVWLDPTGVERQTVLDTMRGSAHDLVARVRERVARRRPASPSTRWFGCATPG